MSVELNEPAPMNYYPEKKSGFANFLVKYGIAKDKKGAEKIMLVITILCFLLSFYFFYIALN